MKKKIPKGLQPLLWSKSIEKLDLAHDKTYIIHQLLSYGDIKHLKWLLNTYDRNSIREIFLKYPQRIYEPAVFYFIKNFVLGFKNREVDEKKYAKTLF